MYPRRRLGPLAVLDGVGAAVGDLPIVHRRRRVGQLVDVLDPDGRPAAVVAAVLVKKSLRKHALCVGRWMRSSQFLEHLHPDGRRSTV
ncbi:MAG: hypothetical protein JW719_01595 [Pirellulales bacterium]|nr:hypothetical protein [Pirellulales bacterium]